MKEKHLGIRINEDLHSKIQFIAQYEDRSISKQILYLIRKCVVEFEEHHGEIPPPKE